MKNALIVVDEQTPVPAAIAAAGAPARMRFVEFFTANIRNPNTRQAYARSVSDFFGWTEGIGQHELETVCERMAQRRTAGLLCIVTEKRNVLQLRTSAIRDAQERVDHSRSAVTTIAPAAAR
jgi:hypothetical protein